MRRLLALLSAFVLVASLAGTTITATALAYGTVFPYTTTSTSQPADGVSYIALTFGTQGPTSANSLVISVSGASFTGGTSTFAALTYPATTLSVPNVSTVPVVAGSTLRLGPSMVPGTAVVVVQWVVMGIAYNDSVQTFTFFGGAPNALPIGTHDGSTLAVANDEYCYANGWAVDLDQESAHLNVRILADEQQVWSGVADASRPDVLEAGYGDGYNGFWVNLFSLVEPDVQHVIRVQAQDVNNAAWVDLDQTPRTITCLSVNTPPTGTHEAVSGATHSACLAAGWAADPDNWAHVPVRISSDGVVIWAGPANEFRQDLLDAKIGDGTYGFQVDIGSLISSDVPHVIRVEAQDANSLQWSDIDWTPLTITCTEIFGTHEGSQGAAARAACRATGWAADLDTPEGPRVQVRIKVDGRVVAETTANQFRQDVLDAGFGDGYSGFSVNLYGKVIPDRAHDVTVEARDTTAKKIWVPLDWTPLQLTCRSH